MLLAQAGQAADSYFNIPIATLKFTEGALPKGNAPDWRKVQWQRLPAMSPYAVIDGGGEAFVEGAQIEPWGPSSGPFQKAVLAIHVPNGTNVTGRLFVPRSDWSGMVALPFTIPADKATPDAKGSFLQAKEAHYDGLLNRGVPGAAWFRHQAQAAAQERGTGSSQRAERFGANRREFGFDDTFELFSGGRALSENLQLNRALPAGRTNGERLVDITNLTGITVREMDWKSLIKDLNPELDPLAAFVPHDQHAVFFPSFAAMNEMLTEADQDGTPLLQWLEPRSENEDVRGRYQKQLCLGLDDLSRLLGPQMIRSVAFTGSDPYLRTGSDVGILFETKSAGMLRTFLLARHLAVKQTNTTVQAVSGEIEGVAYSGIVSPDRSVCSHVAAMDDVVFISNSLYQLGQLVRTAKKQQPAIVSQDEYIFFRHRYARGAKDETAFVVLTDATIRRWCGPRWRIGNSRRTRVAAALAAAQATHLEELVRGEVKARPVTLPVALPEAGEVQLTSRGVTSPVWGTLDFLTPIAEVSMPQVSQTEASAYEQWQTSYQQNWRQFFDPIAIRVSANARQLTAETTVMPLIARTDYQEFINLSSGARIAPEAGDRHPEALVHLAIAINAQSRWVKEAGNFLGSENTTLRANPLGWLGQSISLFADQDPFWEELTRTNAGNEFLETNYHRLPVALQCEVKNPLGVAAFLTGLRAYSEQTAPGMTIWTNAEYNGQSYVRVSSSPRFSQGNLDKLAIYYAVTPRSLVVTLNEAVLKRTLDRQAAREKDPAAAVAAGKPWLGTNVSLQVDQQFIQALEKLSDNKYQGAQQLLAWNNLPILNEWKRLFPSRDPLQVHEQFWQTKLLCPGGGTYVWNAKWQTMESTVYGHPGEPKTGAANATPLARFSGANLGLSFEPQGLSAKAVLERKLR